MQRNIVQEDSVGFLGDVQPEKCFWVNNGPILKNLEDCLSAIKTVSDETFRHHVNLEKNDFSKWIDEVIGDKKLAKRLAKEKNKKSFIKKMEFRVRQLRKVTS